MNHEQLLKNLLEPVFGPSVSTRWQNSVSLRVRIISDRFRGLNRVQREALVEPLLMTLPADVQQDISMLILLTPDEQERRFERGDILAIDFDEPLASHL